MREKETSLFEKNILRRDAIASLGAIAAAAIGSLSKDRGTEPAQLVPLSIGRHHPRNLPFDPAVLFGISGTLIRQHWKNIYAKTVRNLNKIEKQLCSAAEIPGFVVSCLKEHELCYANSMILHEHYFGNLGGNGIMPAAVSKAIVQCFGSLAKWKELFTVTAMSLVGRGGWAVLGMCFHTGDLRVYWSSSHSQSLSFGQPLVVLDMDDHAYRLDFGECADGYVAAFMNNLNWEEVNARFIRSVSALKAIRGTT